MLHRKFTCVACRLFQTSTRTGSLPEEKKTAANELLSRIKAQISGELQQKEKRPLIPEKNYAMNTSFPNKYMIKDFDPAMEIGELAKGLPGYLKENVKDTIKEVAGNFSILKPDILEDIGWVRHGQVRKDITFKDAESFKLWRCGADSDSNEGFSTCEFIPTDHGTALFRGKLSTELIKDGKTERAGWAGIKYQRWRSFNRFKYFDRWRNFSHFLIKCRGDGRQYKVVLNSPGLFDLTWGDAHSYPLYTHGGPYWQYETIPFSKFIFTIRNRVMDRQRRVHLPLVSSLSILLMDRIDGEFELEIDYIGVYNDRTHTEEFAYETYTLPVSFTEGI